MIPHEHKNHPGNRHADNVPGYLLANIPAVLGFYPQESLVLAGLEHREGHTYHLGPVLRADYPVPGEKAVRALAEGVAEGLSMIRSVGSTSVMVFVVGVAPPRSEIAALRRCLWHPGLRIWGGWWCRGIATGERYARLWEESGASRWPGALISEVAQTPRCGLWSNEGSYRNSLGRKPVRISPGREGSGRSISGTRTGWCTRCIENRNC